MSYNSRLNIVQFLLRYKLFLVLNNVKWPLALRHHFQPRTWPKYSIMQLISWRHVTRFESGCTCQLTKFLRWYIWGKWALKISNMWLNTGVVVIKELCKQTVRPYDIFWMMWMCLNVWFIPRNFRWRALSLSNETEFHGVHFWRRNESELHLSFPLF